MSDKFKVYSLSELVEKHKDHAPPPYTEGPWTIEKGNGLSCTVIGEPIAIVGGDETGESVRFTVGRTCDFGPHGPEQTEANARLISAAPDLLAALKLILQSIPSEMFGDYESDLAYAAIAKAEGSE